MSDLKTIIEDSFQQYAGAVLQSRALVDVRDCLKPSARQIFYCLYTDKFLHSKPFKKTLKGIGSAMRMYIHGDSSCEGVIMRAGQPFAMRYPLIEVEGSYGNLMESGNWSAPRYTSARLSALSEYLFKDINKDTIEEWRDNYDDTEQYPAVLPTKGFFNIVNGTMGIGVGAASSIPQFNLQEINNALVDAGTINSKRKTKIGDRPEDANKKEHQSALDTYLRNHTATDFYKDRASWTVEDAKTASQYYNNVKNMENGGKGNKDSNNGGNNGIDYEAMVQDIIDRLKEEQNN